ncbi:MAG: GNAT family N-acetyltransferase [Bacteroidales bacterium]|nr:GNAT family N-acetyltransferase [Bacteroidales bacterium]
MVKKLEWDSNLFGYSIGFVEVNEEVGFDEVKFIEEAKSYKLVYVIASDELNSTLNLRLVDRKVVFTKDLEYKENEAEIVEFNSKKHSYQELLDLAYLSGNSSRFYKDTNFKNNEFEKLYKQWIDKSISNEIAFKVLIKFVHNKLAGFVTLSSKDTSTSQIGLIAVNGLFQGRNIATNLINECEYFAFKKKHLILDVATQLDNKPAMKLYESNKFKIKSINYIYHFWNYDTI